MTRTFTIKDGQAPTQEQLEEVKAAAKREIQFDEDSPELSPAMCKAFRCSIAQRNRKKKNAQKLKQGGGEYPAALFVIAPYPAPCGAAAPACAVLSLLAIFPFFKHALNKNADGIGWTPCFFSKQMLE